MVSNDSNNLESNAKTPTKIEVEAEMDKIALFLFELYQKRNINGA